MNNKDTLIQAINIYNSKHRKYKIEYDDAGNHVIVICDSEDKFKVYIGLEYDMKLEDVIEVLEDLRKELK